jgi:hypothetical protein
VRHLRTGATVALAGAALSGIAPATVLGASRTVTVEGWSARTMAFSGGRLLWTEAATVHVDPRRIAGSPVGAGPFDYYRAEVFRAPLNRASDRFSGEIDTPVSVRTSIAAMGPGVLSPTGDGGFVMAPDSRRFAPPVIWCCTDPDVETVIESDGRPTAPVTVAAAWTGGSVRFLQLVAGGPPVLRSADPAGVGAPVSQPLALATAPGLVAVSPRAVGWVDPAAPSTFQLQSTGAGPVGVALPGPALRVWGAPRTFAVAVRIASRVVLLRIDEAPAPRAVRVWSGARLPRVALGGGAVAVADGRRVLAARRGALHAVVTGRGAVDAVGVEGRRLAWIERGLRRGARVGVVRLGTVR